MGKHHRFSKASEDASLALTPKNSFILQSNSLVKKTLLSLAIVPFSIGLQSQAFAAKAKGLTTPVGNYALQCDETFSCRP